MRKATMIPVAVVSIVLMFYSFLILLGRGERITWLIFSLSPFLVTWMVVSVIRYGQFDGKELKEDQQWGYSDRDDLS